MEGARNAQIRLGNVEYGVPCVEALLHEDIVVLRDAQLREYLAQVSHTVGLCLEQCPETGAVALFDTRSLSPAVLCL